MSTKGLEKLLLLELNVERCDAGGFTDIMNKTNDWYVDFDIRFQNLSPIERIMQIILVGVEDLLENRYSTQNPVLFWKEQKTIGNYRADFAIDVFNNEAKKYIIECDGHDFHEKTKEQAKYDKQRERFFVSNGYKVLRFSGSEIYNDFHKIKKELYEIFSKDLDEE